MNDQPKQPGIYEPPVSELLTLGRPELFEVDDWPDYIQLYSLTAEHIPELERLLYDKYWWDVEYEDDPAGYGFLHAMRALGQLRDEAAVEILVKLAETEDDNDWIWEEIAYAIALSGPSVLPMLQESLKRVRQEEITGLTVTNCFEVMVELHPETRDEVVAFTTSILEDATENDAGVNAAIIHDLVLFKALESLPVIEKAFATNNVDVWYGGDWDMVQVDLGLKEPDPNKKLPPHPLLSQLPPAFFRGSPPIGNDSAALRDLRKGMREDKAKKKAKRKQAKESRKRNRKRKK